MSPAGGPVRAIGRLGPGGPWVGFEPGPGGYRLVLGTPDGGVRADLTADPLADRNGLIAAAIAFYLSLLADPPPELEATQGDMAALVSELAAHPPDATWAQHALEALDAIDDGLAADAVALRLQRLLPAGVDPVELLHRAMDRAAGQD